MIQRLGVGVTAHDVTLSESIHTEGHMLNPESRKHSKAKVGLSIGMREKRLKVGGQAG